MPPPAGTSPREKLHDNVYQKIKWTTCTNDASFKTGSSLIEDDYAFFKFDKFYKKIKKAKDWKYQEEKTGSMMERT